jgi:hypothetical protein
MSILLCQGLIFENDQQTQDSAIYAFGITCSAILIGAIILSIYNTMRKAIDQNAQTMILSTVALSALDEETKQQALQIYSENDMLENGNLKIRRQKLNRLSPVAVVEVLRIVGNAEND